jgi:hypothetical protein
MQAINFVYAQRKIQTLIYIYANKCVTKASIEILEFPQARCKEEKIVKKNAHGCPVCCLLAIKENALSHILETPFLAENLINHWLHHGHESLHHWYPQCLL